MIAIALFKVQTLISCPAYYVSFSLRAKAATAFSAS